jgi:hypothetical protein
MNWDESPAPASYLEQIVSMKRKTWLFINGVWGIIGFGLGYIILG